MAITVSPGWKPATAAGAGSLPVGHSPDGSGSPVGCAAVGVQAATLLTVSDGCGMPMPTSRIANRTKASSRFIVGPPSITTTRLRTGSR